MIKPGTKKPPTPFGTGGTQVVFSGRLVYRPVLVWFEFGVSVEPLGEVFRLLLPDGSIELVAPDWALPALLLPFIPVVADGEPTDPLVPPAAPAVPPAAPPPAPPAPPPPAAKD